jgi:ubiquinone biosynthesis accessory factor UbiJ
MIEQSSMNHLPTSVTAAIELALNQVLALDEETLVRLPAMQGKVIAIELQGLNVILYLIPVAQKITVYGRFEGEADTLLSGTPLALMRMGLAEHAGDVLFSGDVQISGDVELGQAFSEILDRLDIDWEEHLSHISGDLIAHKVGNLFREAMSWGRETVDTLSLDVAEYLQEETDTLPNGDEVEHYLTEVDMMRAAVDRMAARVRRLEAHLVSSDLKNGENE